MSNKIISWINEKSADDAVNKILKQNQNVEGIVQQLLDSRKEFGLKVQQIVEKLNIHLYG